MIERFELAQQRWEIKQHKRASPDDRQCSLAYREWEIEEANWASPYDRKVLAGLNKLAYY